MKTTIRSSQSGWVVYFDDYVENFVVFRSDEAQRFVKFICENVAGIMLDEVVNARLAEKQKSENNLAAGL